MQNKHFVELFMKLCSAVDSDETPILIAKMDIDAKFSLILYYCKWF